MEITRISYHCIKQCAGRKININEQILKATIICKTDDKKHDGRILNFLNSGLIAVTGKNDNSLVTVYYEREKRLKRIFSGVTLEKNVSHETFINAMNLLRKYETENRNHWL